MPLEIDDLTLSQLADGELPPDQVVQTLLAILDDERLRERLHQHLQLRDMSAPWRSQSCSTGLLPVRTAPVHNLPTVEPSTPRPRESRSAAGLLAASVMGGLLVLTGVWFGKSTSGPLNHESPMAVVTPAQRDVIARVFAFHESVAGPLKGYVADDTSVELAAADDDAVATRPLAMLLRLTTAGTPSSKTSGKATSSTHDYIVVCRQDVPVTISLPHADGKSSAGKLFLSPALDRNEVGLRYSLTMEGQTGPAVIAGRQAIGSNFRSLGEVALGDQNVRVEASAWPLDVAR